MSLLLLIVGVVLAFAAVGWFGRQTAQSRNRWRLPVGLVSIGILFAGMVLAVRGRPLYGVPLVVLAIVIGMVARTRPVRRATTAKARAPGLSDSEARAVLGVGPGAGPQEIRDAYNRLIRRIHPDAGGTDGLAAQLNAARDRLL